MVTEGKEGGVGEVEWVGLTHTCLPAALADDEGEQHPVAVVFRLREHPLSSKWWLDEPPWEP